MDKLYNLALNNSALRYLDADTGQTYALTDLPIFELPSIEKKQLAFLYLDNSINSVSVLWSFWRENFALVLLDKSLNSTLKAELENNYTPSWIYDINCKEKKNYGKKIFGNFNLFCRDTDSDYEVADEIKVLLSTSGTTGSPKLVKLSETNILQNALSISDYLPIIPEDITPLNLPLYYSYGLSVFTTNSINGGTVVCTNKTIFDKDFWEDFQKYGYTSLAGVPYIYEMLNRIGFTKKIYPTLRYLTQAGGKLNEKSIAVFSEYCQANKAEFYTMYGQTEATARISFLHPDDLPKKIGSIGVPIKNGKFEIDIKTGELLYSGPNVFGGYALSGADLEKYIQPEILKTGDLGYKDADGFYFIKGRIKRFVKLFGKRINLDDVENLCKSEFSKRTFAAIGLEDKKILIAYQGEEIPKNAIRMFIKDTLAVHPSYIKEEHRDSLPLTANGKINYKQL